MDTKAIRVEGAESMAKFVAELERQAIAYIVEFVATDIWYIKVTGH